MRVTNSMSVLSHTSAIQNNLQKKSKIDEKLNTMKEVNRLSDDPYKAIKVLNFNNEISTTEKYEKNCDEATGWLDATDSALDSLGNVTKNLKETLIAAGNGTYSKDEIQSLSIKINENLKEMGNILNSTHGGKYIFSGSQTGEAPVQVIESKDADGNEIVELKISDKINIDKLNEGLKIGIAQGIDVEYNVKLNDIIPSFDEINNISKAMAKGDSDAIKELTTTHMKNVDKLFESINTTRSTYGIKTNTVESMKKKSQDDLVQLKENLSNTQDVDFATAFMELKKAEVAYTASIQTGAKIMQTTILNFL